MAIVREELHRRRVRRFEDMLVDYRDNSEVAAHPTQTSEEKDCIDRLANTENWFARHAERCLKRISWQGSITDWSEQLHQHLDRFEQAAVGADGGPGMWITRAQMDFLSWQTRISADNAPCETSLFVSTMFLLHMTISCQDASEALKSKHPSLHESLVVALRALNINEVLKFVGDCQEMVDLRVDNPELLRDHLKATAPTIRENILALLQSAQITHAA